MKPAVLKPHRKIKGLIRKSKSNFRPSTALIGQPSYTSSTLYNQKIPEDDIDDHNWAFGDKSARELKALEDLWALSEERNKTLYTENIESAVQKPWIEPPKPKKKGLSAIMSVNETAGPSRINIEEDHRASRNVIESEPAMMQDSRHPARNFVKENMFVRPKITREQERLMREQLERVIASQNTDLYSSRGKDKDKEPVSIKDIKDTDEGNVLITQISEKTFFKKDTQYTPYSQYTQQDTAASQMGNTANTLNMKSEEANKKLWRKSGEPEDPEKQKRRRLIHASLDFRSANASRYTRPKSTGKVGELTRTTSSLVTQQDFSDLIAKLGGINGLEKTRSKSELRSRWIKKSNLDEFESPRYMELKARESLMSTNRRDEQQENIEIGNGVIVGDIGQMEYNAGRVKGVLTKKEEEKATTIERVNQLKNSKGHRKHVQSLKGLDIHFLIAKEPVCNTESQIKERSKMFMKNASKEKLGISTGPLIKTRFSIGLKLRSPLNKDLGQNRTCTDSFHKKEGNGSSRRLLKEPDSGRRQQKETAPRRENMSPFERWSQLDKEFAQPISFKIVDEKTESEMVRPGKQLLTNVVDCSPVARKARIEGLKMLKKSPKVVYLKNFIKKMNQPQ